MSYQYTFIVSNTEPENKQPGTFWFHKTSGVLQYKIGQWAQLNNGGAGVIVDNGIYVLTTLIQTLKPVSVDVGQIWIDDNNTVRMFFNDWIELISGFPGGSAGAGGSLSLIQEKFDLTTISHGQIAIKLSEAQGFWFLGANFIPFAGDIEPQLLNGVVSVFINGVLANSDIKINSLNITNTINERVDTASFIYFKDAVEIKINDTVSIYNSLSYAKLFGGQICRINKKEYYPNSGILIYKVDCVSWEKRLQSKIIAETYSDQKAGDIIKDLITNYLPEFTYANVSDGLLIDYIAFNYQPLDVCIKTIAKETGYNWYVDPDKNMHFFDNQKNIAPFEISDNSNNFNNFDYNLDKSQIRNKILLQGGHYLEEFNDDIQISDGSQETFRTAYKPYAPVSVYVDTGGGYVQKTLGIKNINESGFDFVVEFNEKTIQNLDLAILTSGTKIKITYNRKVPFFSQGQDTASIESLKNFEGGDGVYEFTILDENIITIEAANNRIYAELIDYANPNINGSFTTTTDGLKAGQLLTINLTNFNLDIQVLIQNVNIKIFNEGGDDYPSRLQYNISFMTLLKGLQEFLLEIYNKDRQIIISENEIVNTFRSYSDDIINLTDSVASSTHSSTYLWDDINSKWDFAQWS